ncbi:hypothetical protein XELAEV_18041762mg [Xenopus laevis]|uniref:Uncharacterized protein n=1 Tax=Xenopus laevis TaxID=8355 RepID=A0A974H5F0_XENLA|nr:hypothetical protein XELAEV_18041762mg [Xenopus laevis]
MEENLEPEDLLNNNKEVFQQEMFAKQKSTAAVLGVSSVTQIQHSFTDDPKLEDNDLENNQDTYTIQFNNETVRSEDQQSCVVLCEKSKTLDCELNVLCGNYLLNIQGILMDQEETSRLEAYSGKRQEDYATLEGDNILTVLEKSTEMGLDDYDDKENLDREDHNGFLPDSSSHDRLDPRKERHRYVSDRLDVDVLQLLETNLQKQKLVDIKEELVDMHINIERPHTKSFKGLKNIPQVQDIVLEEPELENTGNSFEEGSKTPLEIDSDDSCNNYAMEMCLIESLQYDLMSKTNKIDKQEIFQRTMTNVNNVPSSDDGTLVLDADLKCEHDECAQKSSTDDLKLSEEQTILHTTEGHLTILEPVTLEKSLQPCSKLTNQTVDTKACIQQTDSNPCQCPSSVALELNQPETEQYIENYSDVTAQHGSDLKTGQPEGSCDDKDVLCPFNEEPFLVDDSSSITESHSVDLFDGVEETLSLRRVSSSAASETHLSDQPFLAAGELSTLHMDLEANMLAVLEKTHTVDCRSSHLQAEAELRNECQSLSKEATELLSMINQLCIGRKYLCKTHNCTVSVRKWLFCPESRADVCPEGSSLLPKEGSQWEKFHTGLQEGPGNL